MISQPGKVARFSQRLKKDRADCAGMQEINNAENRPGFQVEVLGGQFLFSCLFHIISLNGSSLLKFSRSHISEPSLLGAWVASHCHPTAIFFIRKHHMIHRNLRVYPLRAMTFVHNGS
jgi:hypothetical protein